jgi:hypothetical protein
MTVTEMKLIDLVSSLARELEKADNVIRVYESYLTAAKVMQWAEKDVTSRGLGDHADTRAKLLQDTLY